MPTITLPHTPRTIKIPEECRRDCQAFLEEFRPILEPAEKGSWKQRIYEEVSLLAGVE